MKTLFSAMCAALILTAGVAGAATTIIDSAEDTVYTSSVAAAESVALASVPGSEGTNALQISYTHTAEAAWFKNGTVTKTYATPIDISAMEALEFDLNVPVANAGFMFIMMVTDDKGYIASTNFYTAFSAPTTGFQTFSAPLSTFVKNQWKASGRAVNMHKIKSISFNFPNQGAVTAGTFVFSIDNVKLVHGLGLLNETILENFESYADSTALNAAYPFGTGGTEATGVSVALDTANPYAGAKALKMEGTFPGQWYTIKATYTLPSAIDVSTAKYFKMSAHGNANMAGYNPAVDIILIDGTGNQLIGHTWLWGENSEWATFYMPFLNSAGATGTWGCWVETQWDAGGAAGLCNLANITAIRLQLSPQAGAPAVYPLTTSTIFDNIVIGDDTTPASVNDWVLY
jgi:hypothetical protein